MHTLTALYPFAHTASCLHATPRLMVSPGADELLLSRALRLLQVSLETCAFLYHMNSRVYTLTSTQRTYTEAKACRAHMPFTHLCALYTHTDTDMDIGRMYTLKSYTHTRH